MLKNLYQVIFNYFVQKEGYHSTTEILAAVLVGIVILFYIVSFFSGLLLVFNSQILQNLNTSKVYAFVFPIIYFAIVYYTLFYVIKLVRHGNEINNYLFVIDKKIVSLVAIFIITGLVLFGLSIFAIVKYLKP